MNVMISYHALPEIHEHFFNEQDWPTQPIAETMTPDRFTSINGALHFENADGATEKTTRNIGRAWKLSTQHFNRVFWNALTATFEQAIQNRMA